jgi:outer membrane lipoprotein SlyB
MKKKLLLVVAATLLTFGAAGLALAGMTLSGEVVKVQGDEVTVKVDKGQALDVAVGADVEMEVKGAPVEKKAPEAGMDLLMGC